MNSKEKALNKKSDKSVAKTFSKKPNLVLSSLKNTPQKNLQIKKKISIEDNTRSIIPLNNNTKKKFIQYSNIKYGIDESGNPMNLLEYFKSINDSVYSNTNTSIFSGLTSTTNNKIKRPIAYITQDEKGNNVLLDLKGNLITKKNKEGDYYFPLQFNVLVKDFDVKHPELRINGERDYKEHLIEKEIIHNKINNVLINKTEENSNNKNRNKVISRTNDILKFENSQIKNRMNTQNNNYNYIFENFKKIKFNKILTKNKSFFSSIFKFDNSNKKMHISRSKDDLLFKYNFNKKRNKKEINDILKKIFCLKNNKNGKRNNQVDNINFDNEIYKTNCKSQNKNMKNKPQLSMRITPRKRNHKNNIFNLNNPKNNLVNRTYKYYNIRKNKSFIKTNSNKNINLKEKNNLLKKVNKNKIIQINKTRNKNNNIYIDLSRTNKIYNKNNMNIHNSININNNSYMIKKEKAPDNNLILNKIKKKFLINNDKDNFNNNQINKIKKYYILSEEADNMIKSYSRKKLIKEKPRQIK